MRAIPLLALATALAGCTDATDRYPSLLPRPIEKLDLAEPVRPAPVATPDAALETALAGHRKTLEDAAIAFAKAAQAGEARVQVAAGTREGSEPWLAAQAALADMGSARAPTLDVLADVGQLVIERGRTGQPPYPALDGLFAAAEAQAAEQQARIDALEAALAG